MIQRIASPPRLIRQSFAQQKAFSTVSRSIAVKSPLLKITRNLEYPRKSVFNACSGARHNSSLTVPGSSPKDSEARTPPPSYQLTFTCKPCGQRSAHMVSKQGYHHGTVLIQCPSCKNRHVISDHLKIFMDQKSTLEDILKRGAEGGDLSKLLKKGRLGMREGQLVANEGEEGIEFWEDGTETTHAPATEKNK